MPLSVSCVGGCWSEEHGSRLQTSCVLRLCACLGYACTNLCAQAGMGSGTQHFGCTSMDMDRRCQISSVFVSLKALLQRLAAPRHAKNATRAQGKNAPGNPGARLLDVGGHVSACSHPDAGPLRADGGARQPKQNHRRSAKGFARPLHACMRAAAAAAAGSGEDDDWALRRLWHRPSPCCCRIAGVAVPRPWTASLRAWVRNGAR